MNLDEAASRYNRTHTQFENAKKTLQAAIRERAAQPGRQSAKCGAEAGYMAHIRAGESACAACSYARSWATQKRKIAALERARTEQMDQRRRDEAGAK